MQFYHLLLKKNVAVFEVYIYGRVYDYQSGRFLSVDPFISMPGSSQAYNPYSYVMNNPLSYTDPTGYIAESNYSLNSAAGSNDKCSIVCQKHWKQIKPKECRGVLCLVKRDSNGKLVYAPLVTDNGSQGSSSESGTSGSRTPSGGDKSPTLNPLVNAAKQYFLKGTPLDKLGLSPLQAKLMTEFGQSLYEAFLMGDDWRATDYKDKVKTKGDWDFKNRSKYKGIKGIEGFGNFAFGATSAAWAAGATNGISTLFKPLAANIAIRGAGYYQEHNQSRLYSLSNGHFYDIDINVMGMRYGPLNPGTRFGDNKRDGDAILDGHIFFNSYYENR